MPTYNTLVPGLSGGPLITDYPIFINLVPASKTRNRPGIAARKPRRSVQHGTGNSKSTARSEGDYLVAGAEGRQASFHAASDWKELGVFVPIREVTWQAADGGGPGNMNGISCELSENNEAWGDPEKRGRMIHICADFLGRCMAREGGARKPEYHWTFNYAAADRHHCPNFILFVSSGAAKPMYEKEWYAAYDDEKRRMGLPTAPIPVSGWVKGDILGNTVNLNVRHDANLNSPIVAVAPPKTSFMVTGPSFANNGYEWYPVSGSFGIGWIADGWVEKIGHIDPQHSPAPIAALLDTDLKKNDTAEGITSDDNGIDFVFVADVIEFVRDSAGYLYADKETVIETYKKGQREVVAWLFKYDPDGIGPDEAEWFYLTPDPTWQRIPYADTKRISDAPLIPGSEHTQE